MLCVGRNPLQSVTIGKAGDILTEPIVVTMLPKTKVNRHLRLGIEAQRDIGIYRSELAEAAERPQRLTTTQTREGDLS